VVSLSTWGKDLERQRDELAATSAPRDAELALMRGKLATLGQKVEALHKSNLDDQIAIMAISAFIQQAA